MRPLDSFLDSSLSASGQGKNNKNKNDNASIWIEASATNERARVHLWAFYCETFVPLRTHRFVLFHVYVSPPLENPHKTFISR